VSKAILTFARAGLAATLLVVAAGASADTLFLRVGTTLKIDALWCDQKICKAAIPGGEVELQASDVVRVEPDEEVDVDTPKPGPLAAEARGPATIEQLIAEAARRYALPRSLVRAVARAESALRPNAVSPKGALGVMQLMPGTALELGVENAFDAAQNIDAGVRLLRRLLEKYEGRVAEALAAYNAGPGAVAKHRGVPPYRETRQYVRKIVKEFEKGESAAAASRPEPRP
jgi:soluble lytic murein transglycosylase-like protein